MLKSQFFFPLYYIVQRLSWQLGGKESTCNAGDVENSICGSGRSPEKELATHSSVPIQKTHGQGAWQAAAMEKEDLDTIQQLNNSNILHYVCFSRLYHHIFASYNCFGIIGAKSSVIEPQFEKLYPELSGKSSIPQLEINTLVINFKIVGIGSTFI